MKKLLLNSFRKDPNGLAKLLATGNATLTHTQDKSKWGTEFPKLLMEVREELRGTQSTQQQTQQQTPEVKKITRNLGFDLEAQERESSVGLFEGIAYQDYLSYGGTMNQKDFLSLPEEEQQEMIEMQKKCEKR